nr:TIGR02611: TIGR02611 family [uncultured bacterium]
MVEWLTQLLTSWGLTWRDVLLGGVIFVVSFVGSLALVSLVLVKLPTTYFQPTHERAFMVNRRRAVRWSGMVLKNVVGAIMVLLGIIMSVPGVPGQGILTILLGIMLLDFPGKRGFEYKLVSRPKVLHAINLLRQKFGKPPLVLE